MINQLQNKLLFLLAINLLACRPILSHDRRVSDPKALCTVICLGGVAMFLKGVELSILAAQKSKDFQSAPAVLFSADTPIERLSEASAISKREFFEAQASKFDLSKKPSAKDLSTKTEFVEIRNSRSNFDRSAPGEVFSTDIQRYQMPQKIKDATRNNLRRANQLVSNRNNGGRGK